MQTPSWKAIVTAIAAMVSPSRAPMLLDPSSSVTSLPAIVHAGGAPGAATEGMPDGSLPLSTECLTLAGDSVTLALLDLSAECETLTGESVTLAS